MEQKNVNYSYESIDRIISNHRYIINDPSGILNDVEIELTSLFHFEHPSGDGHWEGPSGPGLLTGLTDNYLRVRVPFSGPLDDPFQPVTLAGQKDAILYGILSQRPDVMQESAKGIPGGDKGFRFAAILRMMEEESISDRIQEGD